MKILVDCDKKTKWYQIRVHDYVVDYHAGWPTAICERCKGIKGLGGPL